MLIHPLFNIHSFIQLLNYVLFIDMYLFYLLTHYLSLGVFHSNDHSHSCSFVFFNDTFFNLFFTYIHTSFPKFTSWVIHVLMYPLLYLYTYEYIINLLFFSRLIHSFIPVFINLLHTINIHWFIHPFKDLLIPLVIFFINFWHFLIYFSYLKNSFILAASRFVFIQ